MQPPFWLNAAPRPIPVLPNSCMGGLHLAKRGAAFINFHNIIYFYNKYKIRSIIPSSLLWSSGDFEVLPCTVAWVHRYSMYAV